MRVRLRTIYAGPAGTGGPGDVLELDAASAKALIDGGYATGESEPTAVVTKVMASRRESATRGPEEAAAAASKSAASRRV